MTKKSQLFAALAGLLVCVTVAGMQAVPAPQVPQPSPEVGRYQLVSHGDRLFMTDTTTGDIWWSEPGPRTLNLTGLWNGSRRVDFPWSK